MKKITITLLMSIFAGILFISCDKETGNSIDLVNLSSTELTDKAIVVKRTELKEVLPGKFPLLTNHEGDTIPSQLDDLNADGEWDELFFVVDLAPNDSTHLHLSWIDNKIDYVRRTSVRFGKRDSRDTPVYEKTSDTLYADQIHALLGYQPYQTDGPMWENDKVGFRHYFDGRNAKDLFGKKQPAISPDNVGIGEGGKVEDNYHVMEDWGRDVLSVGNSAGLGGIEMMIGDSVVRLGCISGDTVTNIESAVFNIVSEGPVRSVMEFQYNNWRPDDRNYQVNEHVKIWPGMYAFENTVSVNGLQGDETLLVGLVNMNTEEPLSALEVNDRFIALYTHDKQTYESEWWLGMGLILPKENYTGHGEAPEEGMFSTSYYGKLSADDSEPVTYYAVGCWELSDPNFTDSTYFVNYLENLADQLAADVKVEIN